MQSCVRLKLICRQVINELSGGRIDLEKVLKLVPKDSGFTWSDIEAAISAIAFILSSATKWAVEHDVLNTELQQLGLPKENSDGISRPYRIHAGRLRDQARADSLRFARLTSLRFRVDSVVASSTAGTLRSAGEDTVNVYRLRLGLSGGQRAHPARVPAAQMKATELLLRHRLPSPDDEVKRGSGATGASVELNRLDDALLALGVSPIAPTPAVGGEAGGTNSTGPSSRADPEQTQPNASTGPAVKEDGAFEVALSQEQLNLLLSELKIARKVLLALKATAAPAAAPKRSGSNTSGNATTGASAFSEDPDDN